MRKIVKERILKKCNYICVNCGATKDLQVDHIVPLCSGGRHDEDNLQILCKKCNLTKPKKPLLNSFDKFFIKGDGKNYILMSKNLPLKQLFPYHNRNFIYFIIERQFNKLCNG
jgi:5-methylcytosine-specific restriction endonuclease McrA